MATKLWFETFYNQVWPNYLTHIVNKVTEAAQDSDGLCNFCGHAWNLIGCSQHLLFTCPYIQPCTMESFWKHGPGTTTGIECKKAEWLGLVLKMGSNPFQVITGMEMRVRMAYFDSLVKRYGSSQEAPRVDLDLHKARLDLVGHMSWREELKKYKTGAREHFFGKVN